MLNRYLYSRIFSSGGSGLGLYIWGAECGHTQLDRSEAAWVWGRCGPAPAPSWPPWHAAQHCGRQPRPWASGRRGLGDVDLALSWGHVARLGQAGGGHSVSSLAHSGHQREAGAAWPDPQGAAQVMQDTSLSPCLTEIISDLFRDTGMRSWWTLVTLCTSMWRRRTAGARVSTWGRGRRASSPWPTWWTWSTMTSTRRGLRRRRSATCWTTWAAWRAPWRGWRSSSSLW